MTEIRKTWVTTLIMHIEYPNEERVMHLWHAFTKEQVMPTLQSVCKMYESASIELLAMRVLISTAKPGDEMYSITVDGYDNIKGDPYPTFFSWKSADIYVRRLFEEDLFLSEKLCNV